jgi:hypothetical protein
MKAALLCLLIPAAVVAQDKVFYLSGGGSVIMQPMGPNSYYVYKLDPYVKYPESKQVIAEPKPRDLISEVDAFIEGLRETHQRR